MRRRPVADDQLRPIIRDVFAEMIEELPPSPLDTSSHGAAVEDPHRSPTGSARRVAAVAAACLMLVGGVALFAVRSDDDTATTAPSVSPPPDDDRPAGSVPTPFVDGVRMVVYVGAEASNQSLQFIRDALAELSDTLDPAGIRYLDPDESLEEARRLLVDDPDTLELLDVENIPTAFYITTTEAVTYDELATAAAIIETLPNVTRVDIDPEGRPVMPVISQLQTPPAPAGADVTTSLADSDDVLVDDPLGSGSWSGARTSTDGNSVLLFFVGAADYQAGDPCTMRYVATVEESDTEVRVAIRGERPPGRAACTLLGHGRSIRVDLAQPFGERELIVLGESRDVFNGSTLAHPQWIPDGWQEGPEQPAGLGAGPSAAWSRTWVPPHPRPQDGACTPGPGGFRLFQGEPSIVDAFPAQPGETATDTFDVNGATATYSTDDRGTARLSWILNNNGFVLQTSPTCAGDEPPTIETMLRFARNLEF